METDPKPGAVERCKCGLRPCRCDVDREEWRKRAVGCSPKPSAKEESYKQRACEPPEIGALERAKSAYRKHCKYGPSTEHQNGFVSGHVIATAAERERCASEYDHLRGSVLKLITDLQELYDDSAIREGK